MYSTTSNPTSSVAQNPEETSQQGTIWRWVIGLILVLSGAWSGNLMLMVIWCGAGTIVVPDTAEILEKTFGIKIHPSTIWTTVVGALLVSLVLLTLSVDQLI